MQVELSTKQIYDDHKEETKTIYKGQLKVAKNGSVLEFWNTETKYQIILLENKIQLKKHDQTMVFEQGKKTKSSLQTPYGNINMNIMTNHMEIIRKNGQIQSIILCYEIELEDAKPYQNQIEIQIK